MTTTALDKHEKSECTCVVDGQEDFPKLFGLDDQQQQLLDAFQRSCVCNKQDTGTGNKQLELTIVTGPSGSGKTALAKTLQRHSKFFLLGKCDQISHGCELFGPIATALTQLTEEIFRLDAETIQWFQSRAQDAVPEASEVNLLTDMIPALEKFFPDIVNTVHCQNGASAATTLQRSKAVENPTSSIACKFLRSVCSQRHPIVMVVDDVHWIDSSSLQFIEKLLSEKQVVVEGFMIVATCRCDVVTGNDPFYQTIKKLKGDKNSGGGGMTANNIQIHALSVKSVAELVVDSFPTLVGQDVEALSTVLHTHTKGNGFYIKHTLQRLKTSGWKAPENYKEMDDWDSANERSMINHLTALNCDTLVDIVVADTAKESFIMDDVLKTASCLGADFVTSHLLAVLHDVSAGHVMEALALMAERELIRPSHNTGTGSNNAQQRGWSWTHDKFQKAAYLLIGKTSRRQSFHLKVGRRLLSTLDEDELQKYLFIVVSQFCISLKLIKKGDEMETIAGLLLQAGGKASNSSSFNAAASYYSMGMSLLKEDNWKSQYELSLGLYNAAAEMECCRGNFTEADRLVNVILRHAKSLQDRLRPYETKLHYLNVKDEHHQVINLGLDVMEQLGEKFPKKPSKAKIVYEIMSTRWLLSKTSVEDIMSLQPLTDWKINAILRMAQMIFSALHRGNQELTPIIVCRSIKLTLKYGITGTASFNFGTMCIILSHPLGYLDEGHKCARICEAILEKHGVEDFFKCRVYLLLRASPLPFKVPLQDTLEPLDKTISIGLVTGDIESACFCSVVRAYIMFYCGMQLDQLAREVREYLVQFRSWGQPIRVSFLSILQQLAENLTRPKEDPCELTGTVMNDKEWFEKVQIVNDSIRIIPYWLIKAFIALYLGDHERARIFMDNLLKENLGTAGGGSIFMIYFLDALIDIILARDKDNKGKARKYKSPLKKLIFYGKDCPENVNNKVSLIEAEVAVLKKDKILADSKFRESIAEANRNGPIFEEALAYERYAIAVLEWGDVTRALDYFEKANDIYHRWGSSVKMTQLKGLVKERSGVTMPSEVS